MTNPSRATISEICPSGHYRGQKRCAECQRIAYLNKKEGILKHPLRALPAEERLLLLTDKTPGQGPKGECWTYTGPKTKGYGVISKNGHHFYAHRLAYLIAHGEIPEGLDVCHHCDFPPCIRPAHLFAGDESDNLKDMGSKGRQWLQSRPQDSPTAKLTWEDVRAIREGRKKGIKRKVFAEKYGICLFTVTQITTGQHWKENR